jgi:hypothetical protein
VRVAVPRLGEQVAPCFRYAATIAIFTIARGKVIDEVDFCFQSNGSLDRFRLLRDQQMGALSAALRRVGRVSRGFVSGKRRARHLVGFRPRGHSPGALPARRAGRWGLVPGEPNEEH